MSHFSSPPVGGGDFDGDDFDGEYEYDEGEEGYEEEYDPVADRGVEAYRDDDGDYEDDADFEDEGDQDDGARAYRAGAASGYATGRQGARLGSDRDRSAAGRVVVAGRGAGSGWGGSGWGASGTGRGGGSGGGGGTGWDRSSDGGAPYRPRHATSDASRSTTEAHLESFTVTHRRRPWILWLVGAVVLLLVVIGIGAVAIRNDINPGHPGAPVSVTIPKGASTDQIGTILAKAGVIESPSVFRLYTKVKGVGVLLPGTYHLPRSSSYHSVVAALEAGPPIAYQKFTIPEGFTLAQIADRVGALPGRSAADFLAAANSGQVRSQFQPAGSTNLEGLLFPATYTVRADDSDLNIVQTMVQTFDDNVGNLNLTQAATALGVTPYQVIVVASMVEREAKLDADRGPIASVIYNRLKANMLLQIDATVLYGEGITDPSKMDTNSNSPYNTYKFKGLPPTPISSPGLPSLTAAAGPPSTNYLYYVVIDSTGKSGFAATAQQFQGLLAQAHANGVR